LFWGSEDVVLLRMRPGLLPGRFPGQALPSRADTSLRAWL